MNVGASWVRLWFGGGAGAECGQRCVIEDISLELALTVPPTADKELGQGRVPEEGADKEDYERYGYFGRGNMDLTMNETVDLDAVKGASSSATAVLA